MKKMGLLFLFIIAFAMVPQCEAAPIEIKYFYSTGCSHCKTTSNVLDQVQDHYGDLVHIDRINVNSPSNQAVWEDYSQRFTINGVPAIVINDDRKLEGDIRINYNAVVEIIDELLQGIEVRGDELYSQGMNYMGEGKFEAAIDIFNEAIEIFTASDNQVKIALCNQRIQESNDYILARTKFIEAEDYYRSLDYVSAKPLYEEIISIYNDLGNTSMASTSEIRLENCNFNISYASASSLFDSEEWADAIVKYNEAKSYTSNNETIEAINELISFCESQISAQELYDLAEAAFSAGEYVEAKQYYGSASELFSDSELIIYCNNRMDLCDSYVLAEDTYDYALSLFSEEDYEESMYIFTNAKDLYTALGEEELASQCEDYIDECQTKLDEIEQQKQQEEEEREHQRFMKMVYISVAALVIIVFFVGLILYLRRGSAATDDESEYSSEYEENERETE